MDAPAAAIAQDMQKIMPVFNAFCVPQFYVRATRAEI
jgi:hypothetical protein